MESIKDYLDRLEINNNILNKQLKDVYVSKVVYFREDKIVYFHLYPPRLHAIKINVRHFYYIFV